MGAVLDRAKPGTAYQVETPTSAANGEDASGST
jgi:hypothetical protein